MNQLFDVSVRDGANHLARSSRSLVKLAVTFYAADDALTGGEIRRSRP